MSYYHEIEGQDCCRSSTELEYKCWLNSVFVQCYVDICDDGTIKPTFGYCSFGGCNIFGCNCDGGCRMGTSQSAIANFKRLYPEYELKQ